MVKEEMAKKRYRDFPVIDRKGDVYGLISRRRLLEASKKRVIVVDHNEKSQAVDLSLIHISCVFTTSPPINKGLRRNFFGICQPFFLNHKNHKKRAGYIFLYTLSLIHI